MHIAKRIIYPELTYTFPAPFQVRYNATGFRNIAAQLMKLPGLDGGIDQFGSGPGQTVNGDISIDGWFEGDTPTDVQNLLDAAGQLADLGIGRLYIQPEVGLERFCHARLNANAWSQNVRDVPHRRQRVQFNFQVAQAKFYSDAGYWPPFFDGTYDWDGTIDWGENTYVIDASGVSTEDTLTIDGNATAQPIVSIRPESSDTVENVRVQRVVGGQVMDEISYAGTLTDTDELSVDGGRQYSQLNGVTTWGPNVTYRHPELFRLAPGANTIRILAENAGDAVRVRIWYLETWR